MGYRVFVLVMVLAFCVAAQALAAEVLLVSRPGGWSEYDCATGSYLSQFGGISGTRILATEPNGILDVFSGSGIVRYDIESGTSIGTISLGAYPGGCGGMAWGPDGRLYLANTYSNRILCCDVSTGTIQVVNLSVNISQPYGITFGADGDLYVCAYWQDSGSVREVGRIRLSDGTLVERYGGSNDLIAPQQVASTADGAIFALDQCASGLYRLDRSDGRFYEVVAGGPELGFTDMASGAGDSLFLMQYQSSGQRMVYRYDQQTHTASYFAPGGTGYIAVATIPEPSSGAALLAALGALASGWRMRRCCGRDGGPTTTRLRSLLFLYPDL